jgi:sugar lactone lactonase YvrE
MTAACGQDDVNAPPPASTISPEVTSEAANWQVSLLAGASPLYDENTVSKGGFRDGAGDVAEFQRPVGVALAPDGSLYIADSGNRRIRRLTTDGQVETVAGSGKDGTADGPALQAEFRVPVDVAFGPDGTLYIVDSYAGQIRSLTPDGQVHTVAGFDQGQCDDTKDPAKLPPGCPSGQPYRDGPAAQALFAQPSSVAVAKDGTLYVADAANDCIRSIDSNGNVSLYAGTREAGHQDGPVDTAQMFDPVDLAFGPDGSLYFTDQTNHVRRIDAGVVTTIAGGPGKDGHGGFADGSGEDALFRSPTGIAVGPDGSVFIADAQNGRVRRIDTAGNVTTIAGTMTRGFSTGSGDHAQLTLPSGVAVAPNGTIYVDDYNVSRVIKITQITEGGQP